MPSLKTRPRRKRSLTLPRQSHIAKSGAPVGLVVVADVDMLADGLWVTVQDLFGQRVAVPNANNGAFFANVLENLTGSADLIGLRSRGGYQRPFTMINDIQRDAERKFRTKEQELLQELEAVQKKLTNVKRASDPSGKTSLVLTDEQRAEIDAAQQQMLKVRKELRDVQFALRSDVEALTGKIKAANVVLMPLIIAILALFGAFCAASTAGRSSGNSRKRLNPVKGAQHERSSIPDPRRCCRHHRRRRVLLHPGARKPTGDGVRKRPDV